ncbi:PREDICTED: serine/threonine-protein kinase grp-like [Polistes canadensis]|uniref:serine/threonine-protein kinase grp-like n=1 Tax=Polistes canadensis TaxID=91411 RepID=UPI000718C7EB|nr:PREDICTED: serine/threonine-protein kinase grp-like [Polistes canadensis]
MTEFVEGWILGHTLGEGAYGEVKLVINKTTGEAVAMKMVDVLKHPDARQSVKKETTIHRMLSNSNIIQFFGKRSEPTMEYIFLEYASGGELYDRIEPDIGMPKYEAQRYFKQLICAVEYLHSRGVAHRDLKPENLLLDDNDNLKITDFGLATIFRVQGRERTLEKKCGTLPYVAPEVLVQAYYAEPADIWSCGIILVALLCGELPWDQSLAECPEYVAWRKGTYMSLTPWKKLDNLELSLIKKILAHLPSARYTIPEIKNHRWFLTTFKKDDLHSNRYNMPVSNYSQVDGCNPSRSCLSQPDFVGEENVNIENMKLDEKTGFSFSQPAHIEDLLLCTQPMQCTAHSSSQTPFQQLVRRMTRFFVKTDFETTVKRLLNCLQYESYTYRINDFRIITISTVVRKRILTVNVSLIFIVTKKKKKYNINQIKDEGTQDHNFRVITRCYLHGQ